MKPSVPRIWIALIATVLGLTAAAVIPLLFLHLFPDGVVEGTQAVGGMFESVIPLSVMAFAGVIGLIAFLALVAFIFAVLGLADPEQALGLPEGSVRAVIALSLIVIFVISSLFLFGRLSEGQTLVVGGLTSEQVAQIPGNELISRVQEETAADATPTFTITRHLGPSQESVDFSRQMLTTISTLVVAIASFYFGAKAVKTGAESINEIARRPPGGTAPPREEPPPEPEAPDEPTTAEGGPPPPPERPTPPESDSTDSQIATAPEDSPAGAVASPEIVAHFTTRRLSTIPPSTGTIERRSGDKLVVVKPETVTADAEAASLKETIGEIASDHWLSTAVRMPIGKGDPLEPHFVIIHYTEGYSADSSVSYWKSKSNGVLAHVIVDRDGTVIQCRPFNQKCWHAGRSRLRFPPTSDGKLYDGLNDSSIGIEIANTGDGGSSSLHNRLTKHFPQAKLLTGTKHRNAGIRGSCAAENRRENWERYPQTQLDAVFGLVKLLRSKYDILDITGHDCVAYERKTDPGPAFPMQQLREESGLEGLPDVWNKSGERFNV